MKQEQEMMQKKFWDDMFLYGGVSAVVVVGCLLLYMAVDFLFLGTQNDPNLSAAIVKIHPGVYQMENGELAVLHRGESPRQSSPRPRGQGQSAG
jgi:hypothetical protein